MTGSRPRGTTNAARAWLLGVALGVAPVAAGAADTKPMYGGAVVEVQEISFELLIRRGGATIFVSDHGKPVSTQGASGTLTLVAGAEKVELPLVGAGPNELRAEGATPSDPAVRSVAIVKLPGKRPITVRFPAK